MAALPAINLYPHWQYSADQADWQPLADAGDWPQHALTASDRIYLRRKVFLSPTDFCVRYRLHLENAPENTEVWVNGWRVGTTHGRSFAANVTDQVMLDDNFVVLKLSQAGAIGGIYLQPEPCE